MNGGVTNPEHMHRQGCSTDELTDPLRIYTKILCTVGRSFELFQPRI